MASDGEKGDANGNDSGGDDQGTINRRNGDRWMLITVTVLSSFLISGIIFGWAPLMLILRSDGVDAKVGESVLTATYTAGVMAQVASSPFAGTILDMCGPRNTCAFGFLAVIIGLCLVADAGKLTMPLGYAFMGFGACLNYFASFATSFLFPEHQAVILATINCGFDAGAIVFYLFYVLYEVPNPCCINLKPSPHDILQP